MIKSLFESGHCSKLDTFCVRYLTLRNYLKIYNHNIPQRALNHLTQSRHSRTGRKSDLICFKNGYITRRVLKGRRPSNSIRSKSCGNRLNITGKIYHLGHRQLASRASQLYQKYCNAFKIFSYVITYHYK